MRAFTSPIFVFLSAIALIGTAACGSSSSGGTGGATTTTTSGTTATGGSGTGGSTGTGGTATGGSTGSGGAATCQQQCITDHPAEAQKFEGYELESCGCAASSPCIASCTAECADPTTLSQSSPCGQCLLGEAGKGQSSTCTAAAGGKCIADSACQAFVTCALGC